MAEAMDMYALIASEFHVVLPDSTPIYQIQFMAKTAEKRRTDRQKAAAEGKIYIG